VEDPKRGPARWRSPRIGPTSTFEPLPKRTLMAPRKTILRELKNSAPGTHKRPNEIPGFERNAAKYREAVNGLLKDQLIQGAQDDQGKLVVSLNAAHEGRVRRELRPWFTQPLVWGPVILAVGVGAVALLMG
jgi:hypothetical protein